MLSGLGKYAKKGDEIIPGILICADRMRKVMPGMDDLSIITAHSRDIMIVKNGLLRELKNGKNIVLLPDPSFGVKNWEFIKNAGFSRRFQFVRNLDILMSG